MSRQDLDRLGAHYDGVEILHVDPGPEPGSRLEKRAIRQVGLTFTMAGVFAFLFVLVYVGSGWFLPDWHWEISEGGWSALFTPLLGLLMGLSLLCVGVGLVLFTKKLLPARDGGPGQARRLALRPGHRRRHAGQRLPQQRARPPEAHHPVPGAHGRRRRADADHAAGRPDQEPEQGQPARHHQLGRGRPAGPQRRDADPARRPGARLARDGLPGRPRRQPAGRRRDDADPPPAGAARVAAARGRATSDFAYGEYVAYSKICTHAGCPVSLYEQETSRILCPCHQSQFDVTQGAKPVFGPATRALPQLPIGLDDEGFFVARSDYIEAVGPTYWNRERI